MFFARLRDFLGSTCWIPAPGYDVTGQQISNKPQITNDFIRVQRRAYHLTRDIKGNIIRWLFEKLRSIQGHLTLIQVQVNLSGAANIRGRKRKEMVMYSSTVRQAHAYWTEPFRPNCFKDGRYHFAAFDPFSFHRSGGHWLPESQAGIERSNLIHQP